VREQGFGRRLVFLVETNLAVQPHERCREPPRQLAGQPKDSGEEQAAHEQGVGEDGERRADTQDLQHDDVRGPERADRDGEEEGGCGDDPADDGNASASSVATSDPDSRTE
jgi:hypothetical protein